MHHFHAQYYYKRSRQFWSGEKAPAHFIAVLFLPCLPPKKEKRAREKSEALSDLLTSAWLGAASTSVLVICAISLVDCLWESGRMS